MNTPTGTPAPTLTHTPSPKQVKELLTDLLGKDVTVTDAPAWTPSPTDHGTCADLIDDHDTPRAIALVDLPLSAYLGAAVGLLPAARAHEAVKDNDLSGTIADNLYEVINIMTSLFNIPDRTHLRIHDSWRLGTRPPVPTPQHPVRVDLTITITGYGTGRLALVLLD